MDLRTIIDYHNELQQLKSDHHFGDLYHAPNNTNEDCLVAFRRYIHINQELKKAKITSSFVNGCDHFSVSVGGWNMTLGAPYGFSFKRWFRDNVTTQYHFNEEYEPAFMIEKVHEYLMKTGSKQDIMWSACIAAIFRMTIETINLKGARQPILERRVFQDGVQLSSRSEPRSHVERYNFVQLFS